MLKCRGSDDNIYSVTWMRFGNAYLPAITVCNQGLFPIGENFLCPDNQTYCNGSCVNLNTDTENCGACNVVCDEDEFCVNGECVPIG